MIDTEHLPLKTSLRGPLNHAFTSANAREMQSRQQAAMRARRATLEAQAAAGRAATPQSERLAKEITRIEELMAKTCDEDRLQKLSAAHQRLFSAWMVLSGTQRPGVRKSSRRPDRAMIEPTPQPIDQPRLDTPNEPNG